MELKDLAGQDLGTRTITWDARDAILYALAVGASCDESDLVYERDLRVLPTFACALGLWAVERAGGLGAYDRNRSLHAAQSLELHAPMPRSGSFAARGQVADVWDKGKAAIVDIAVECEVFTVRYGIFLPGRGGWGGERGPSASSPEWATVVARPPRDRPQPGGAVPTDRRPAPDSHRRRGRARQRLRIDRYCTASARSGLRRECSPSRQALIRANSGASRRASRPP